MILDSEIEQKALELDVSPQHVERDYVHGWLLKEIFQHEKLSKQLVLKGGNAIRKGYLAGSRYSKDLDFSTEFEIDEAELLHSLQAVLTAAASGSGVTFDIDRAATREKRINIPGVSAIEARVYFKGFYADETITLRSHLDISEFEKCQLPIQTRTLLHPYSDGALCTGVIQCQKLEEVLASKLTTLLFRRKAQDLFDLLFSVIFNREFPISRAEVIRTFLKKSIYGAEARQARSQLLALPLDIFSDLWDGLVMPRASRFTFDAVKTRFAT